MIRRATIHLLFVTLVAGTAVADARRNPDVVDRGSVREVVDGDTVVLESATQVRLVGIQAPKLALGRAGFRPWPLAEESKALLETLTLRKSLRLSYGGRRIDRHGRLLAHLEDAEGRWIQGEMLSAGLARVYSFADNRSRVSDMLALENKARSVAVGIWSNPYYRVRSATETPKFIDTFQIVEGRIVGPRSSVGAVISISVVIGGATSRSPWRPVPGVCSTRPASPSAPMKENGCACGAG